MHEAWSGGGLHQTNLIHSVFSSSEVLGVFMPVDCIECNFEKILNPIKKVSHGPRHTHTHTRTLTHTHTHTHAHAHARAHTHSHTHTGVFYDARTRPP